MRFNPKRKHSHAYYRSVLLILIPGLAQGLPYEVIRLKLASSGTPSPTNGEWSIPALNGVIARLRKREGHFFHALLEMFFSEDFTKTEVHTALRSF